MLPVLLLSIQQRLDQIAGQPKPVPKEENMLSSASDSQVSTRGSASEALRGTLVGLVPLIFLIAIIAITLGFAVFARLRTVSGGFFAQQQAALITLIVGFVLAIVAYVVAILIVMRRVRTWQQEGVMQRARAALWALGVTALIVVLPMMLVIVVPQHPAP
jgi:uncharacterized membrane protein